ncbi:MAG: hypothetical protein R6V62_05640 [Candidatus Fermentibacteraceae bacterium]
MKALPFIILLLLCGCNLNSDPVENAPTQVLGEACDHEHSHHEAGHYCSETRWFFTQPWAAEWYWGKLLRDGLVLLVLAGAVTLLSRRRST